MADTQQYWDGSAWTGQIAPTSPKEAAGADKVPCSYCSEPMTAGAARCPSCTGIYFWCKHDKANLPVHTKRKFVGFARGGTEDVHRCQECGRILSGPKW